MKVRHRSSLAWGLLAASLTVFAFAGTGSAQTAQNCLEAQSRFAGTICRGMAKCHVKAMKHSTSIDPDCVPGRKTALINRYNSIEAGDNCLTEPAGNTIANSLETGVGNIASPIGTGQCASKKMGALGRECKQMMMCYADSAASSAPGVDSDCLSTAINTLMEQFDKIEDRNICNTTGDASNRSDDVDMLTDQTWTYLRGVGTTTTSTTTTTSSSTTTTIPPTCLENGAYDPCVAYRDNAACKTCVDSDTGPDAGIATSLCTAAGPTCSDADKNSACGYAINSSTDCSLICCP
ncbi:MAG TPA: hypothetical protein VN634_13070 [Candidatus Limnocylindrales bacterium]|nr:hypothetical protein [Candidatus Limnocylindrales bacterium]